MCALTSRMRIPTLFLVTSVALFGCDNGGDSLQFTQDGAAGLAPMDVAFMIPPGQFADPLTLSTQGAGGELLPEGFFAPIQAEGFNSPQQPGGRATGVSANPYSTFQITALRYDPCAPRAFHGQEGTPTPDAQCIDLFRLVAQPVSGLNAADAALHLVYVVPEGKGREIRDDLRALKAACSRSTSNSEIDVHECLGNQASGRAGFFTNSVRPLITKWAGAPRLAGVASMITNLQTDTPRPAWEWNAFDVIRNGVGAPTGLALTSDNQNIPGVTSRFLNDGTIDSLTAAPNKQPAGAPSSQFGTAGGQSLSSIAMQPILQSAAGNPAAILSAYAVENPRLTFIAKGVPDGTTGVVDCASCHVQSAALQRIEDSNILDTLGIADAIAAVKYPLPLARNAQTNNWFVLNFGFVNASKSISRRTRAETLETIKKIDELDADLVDDGGDGDSGGDGGGDDDQEEAGVCFDGTPGRICVGEGGSCFPEEEELSNHECPNNGVCCQQ